MSQFNAFEKALDFSFWKELCETRGERILFKRGEYFVHAGEVLQRVGWIISGGFKHSLTDNNGNVKAVGFVFEDAVLANYLSALSGVKMPTDIIALEDSEAMVIPASYVRDILDGQPELKAKFLEVLFGQAYDHVLDTYRFTPEQRYANLISRFPRIFDFVSIGDLASYLNISRRQLYRFRSQKIK
ncbi:Crp/Fnr family transcriptional regulator [uncultured Duncaniella sp.]|uniref:Crp/Fnr family transcriptional regulator n=1 Tax=uncultured Duncaniella sp. TaxID=2768039 RepID=UPI0023C5C962|nr:Crp/Fnr family transcriptional regulator [uncultured Duncaniella sp.]MDE5665850.1 Crp/Fnr family transcriptional regulator [Duncaniella sp.]MDE6187717.1 Crp/Fnr family transcriptional regulator [Duncaniella sp.]